MRKFSRCMAYTLCLYLSSVKVLKMLNILAFTFTQWTIPLSAYKQEIHFLFMKSEVQCSRGSCLSTNSKKEKRVIWIILEKNHTKCEHFQEGVFIFYCAMSTACCLLIIRMKLKLGVPCWCKKTSF